jgi:hypothetical protein
MANKDFIKLHTPRHKKGLVVRKKPYKMGTGVTALSKAELTPRQIQNKNNNTQSTNSPSPKQKQETEASTPSLRNKPPGPKPTHNTGTEKFSK